MLAPVASYMAPLLEKSACRGVGIQVGKAPITPGNFACCALLVPVSCNECF